MRSESVCVCVPTLLPSTVYLRATKAHSHVIGQYYADFNTGTRTLQIPTLVPCPQIPAFTSRNLFTERDGGEDCPLIQIIIRIC